MVFVNKSVLPWGSLYAPGWRKGLIMVLNMLALSCSVVGIVLVVEKTDYAQIIECFKFPLRHVCSPLGDWSRNDRGSGWKLGVYILS